MIFTKKKVVYHLYYTSKFIHIILSYIQDLNYRSKLIHISCSQEKVIYTHTHNRSKLMHIAFQLRNVEKKMNKKNADGRRMAPDSYPELRMQRAGLTANTASLRPSS
jgi:hypothetical protein